MQCFSPHEESLSGSRSGQHVLPHTICMRTEADFGQHTIAARRRASLALQQLEAARAPVTPSSCCARTGFTSHDDLLTLRLHVGACSSSASPASSHPHLPLAHKAPPALMRRPGNRQTGCAAPQLALHQYATLRCGSRGPQVATKHVAALHGRQVCLQR